MSKHDFPWTEFAERRHRLREALRRRGIDWVVFIHPVLIHWLTGSDAKSYQEFQCLFFPADEAPLVVLTRAGETNEFRDDAWADQVHGWGGGDIEDPIPRFCRVVDELGLRKRRVAIDVPSYYLHPHHFVRLKEFLGTSVVADNCDWIHELKAVKSPAEIQYIRVASRLADLAMKAFIDELAPGKSELALAGVVYHSLLVNGGGIAASPINLVSGARSCFSHGAPTNKIVQSGEFGSIEFGATFHRYTSTIGRQFCLGRPTSRMLELYDLVRKASDACIAEIRDGVSALIPFDAAKRVIAQAGLDQCRVHTVGYGLAPGFPPTWGEPIHMMGGSTAVLRAGMVVTIEPPVFLDREPLGARIIDNVLVTTDGCELLSGVNRDLIVK